MAVAAAMAVVGAGAVVVVQGFSSGSTDNLIDYSGFRYGAEGWTIRSTSDLDVRRTSPGVLGSQYALRLESSRQTDVSITDARGLPTTKAGATYTGVVYVRSATAGVTGSLKIRELDGSRVVSEHATQFKTRTTWSRVVVRHAPRAGGHELSIGVSLTGLPGNNAVVIDRLRLMLDGSSGSGGSGGGGTGKPPVGRPNTGTLFGASIDQKGRSWDAAVQASDSRYSRLDVVRVFYPGMPNAWPGRAGVVGRPVVVSFKAPPQQVLAGRYDSELKQWFANAPTGRDIWWSYWHEPEDNVASGDFTAQQWRDAYRRVAGFARQASNPSLHSTVILMCWTANPNSGRSVPNFFPGGDVVETLAWDCYNQSQVSYWDPATMFSRAIAASRDLGVGFGIAELGSKLRGGDGGVQRAAWLRKVAAHLSDQGAEFVTYFDNLMPGGEFRLLDSASQQAWRDVVAW
jgi:hypothetical protein